MRSGGLSHTRRRAMLRSILLAVSVFAAGTSLAAEDEFDALHHTADGYYLDLSPFAKVELPRLFIVREGGMPGLLFFASTKSALRSGRMQVESHDEHVVETEELIRSGGHLDAHLVPTSGNVIIDVSITRHLVFALLAAAIVLLIFVRMARLYQKGIGRDTAPRGLFQNMMESLVIFVRDEIAKPNLKEAAPRFLPFLLTVFFFVFVCNLLGLVPLGSTATSNLTITAALALITFILTQVNGSRDHWLHVFWPPGIPTPIRLLLIPTEVMGLFTKPVALAIRLFANMTAGHLVILSLIGLIFSFAQEYGSVAGYGVVPVSLAFTLFVYLLELLIATIQAYIFAFLSALFIGMAIEEHSHPQAAHA